MRIRGSWNPPDTSRLRCQVWLALLLIQAATAAVAGDEPAPSGMDPSFTTVLTGEPTPAPAAPATEFGAPGTHRRLLVAMLGWAPEADELLHILNIEYDYFIWKNTSLNVHIQGFFFDQPGPDAFGLGPAVTLRRYFWVRKHSNLFVAGGIGVIYSDQPVPEIIGSKFNLAPRAAIGFTRDIGKHARMVGGLRVSHLDGLVGDNFLTGKPFSRTVLQPFIGVSLPF